jgi:putative intracellular protease/amidase
MIGGNFSCAAALEIGRFCLSTASGENAMVIGTALFVVTSETPGMFLRGAAGFHFPALAVPYYVLQDSGIAVEIASVKGGAPRPDPASFSRERRAENPEEVNRFLNDVEAMFKLENSRPAGMYGMAAYDALYLVGGEDVAADLDKNPHVRRLVREACASGKPAVAPGDDADACAAEEAGRPLRLERIDPLTFRTAGEKIRDAILAMKNISDVSGGIESENGLVKSLRL